MRHRHTSRCSGRRAARGHRSARRSAHRASAARGRSSSAHPRACAIHCSIRCCSGRDCSWPAGRAAVSTPSTAMRPSSWRRLTRDLARRRHPAAARWPCGPHARPAPRSCSRCCRGCSRRSGSARCTPVTLREPPSMRAAGPAGRNLHDAGCATAPLPALRAASPGASRAASSVATRPFAAILERGLLQGRAAACWTWAAD